MCNPQPFQFKEGTRMEYGVWLQFGETDWDSTESQTGKR